MKSVDCAWMQPARTHRWPCLYSLEATSPRARAPPPRAKRWVDPRRPWTRVHGLHLGQRHAGVSKTLQGYITPHRSGRVIYCTGAGRLSAGGVPVINQCQGAYSPSRCTCRQVETHVCSPTQDTHTHFRNIHLRRILFVLVWLCVFSFDFTSPPSLEHISHFCWSNLSNIFCYRATDAGTSRGMFFFVREGGHPIWMLDLFRGIYCSPSDGLFRLCKQWTMCKSLKILEPF